jgi:hypothetical protein
MIIDRWTRATVLVAGAALATACAPSIRSERDENIPVPQGATWAWAARASVAQDSGARGRYIPERLSYDPIAQQRFRRAIEGAMQERGFRKADDTAQADFLLGFAFSGSDAYRQPVHGVAAVSVGFSGGWGYRPFGVYRPWGFYRPWGWYPWGWGFAFGGFPYAYGYAPAYYAPYGGGGAYRDGWLTVELRLRSDGETAWVGRYRTEEHEVRRMSQEKIQQVVHKLFDTLR